MGKVKVTRCIQDEIDKVISLTVVTLQIKRAYLWYEKLEVFPLLRPNVRINATHLKLLHCHWIVTVQLDKPRNWIHITVILRLT